MKYRVFCQLKNEEGTVIKQRIHECINMDEVFGLVEVCNRCGWEVSNIFDIQQ